MEKQIKRTRCGYCLPEYTRSPKNIRPDVWCRQQRKRGLPYGRLFASFSLDNPGFQQKIVPVIFITNKAIRQCTAADIEKLARNCADRIDTLYRLHFNKLPTEYQFDCDWTEKTKENYFNFLNHIRKLRKGVPISCTIRLHQIKFKDKTGIPPVDKGTLMYYASSEPTDFENENTILNNKDALHTSKDRFLSAASGHRTAALQLGNREKSVRTD